MSHYIISRGNLSKSLGVLDAVVVTAGSDDREQAVALFTDHRKAETYLQTMDVKLAKAAQVVELLPGQLGQWLFEAIRSGIRLLAVNPLVRRQRRGKPQPALDLQSQLEYDGQTIAASLRDGLDQAANSWGGASLFHCDQCGHITIQTAAADVPICCLYHMESLLSDLK